MLATPITAGQVNEKGDIMTKHRQILLRVLTLLLVLSALFLPMTALAQGNGRRPNTDRTIEVTVRIPWDANRPYPVSAGRILVMFFPGSLPQPEDGGTHYTFTLSATERPDRGFIADLALDPPVDRFLRPVPVKFGAAKEVYYCKTDDCAVLSDPIPTRGGWVRLEHFSRYSGWY
jgi:hypothetical protein